MKATAPPLRSLIVTADDFGLSLPINEAIEEAHCRGILTSASLMVGGPAAEDAVRRARRLPSLGVGLHLTLIAGQPVLARSAVPDLVDEDGRLSRRAVRSGIRLALSRKVRDQAKAEIRAQLDAFRRTGLPLDHVDGHRHYHQHPVVLRSLCQLAKEYGIRAVRVPYEPFWPSWRAMRDRPAGRLATAVCDWRRARGMKRRLRAAGIVCNDAVFGIVDSGRMTRERLLAYLANLPTGVSEIYAHPATYRWTGADAPRPDYDPAGEFAALIDPDVIAAANRPEIRRLRFSDLLPDPDA